MRLVDGSYQKDLTIIEADLAKVAIVDNTPEVTYSKTQVGRPLLIVMILVLLTTILLR